MGCIKTIFLGKEYSIPDDVLTYIDLLDFTVKEKTQLVKVFIQKLKAESEEGNIGLLGDEDLAAEIEQYAGKLISKLCNNGIFTRTVRDYLADNKGYKLYSEVNKAALEKMKSLLLQELDAWQAGYEDAVKRAESHVTGIGFSVLSSSFVNHAIYAAMETSTLNKQGKEAEEQYQKDMNDLRSRLDLKYGGEKSQYINITYIPDMEAALTVIAYELLDKYVADLIDNGKFDGKALCYIDIARSNDLLKNLTLSNNKKAVIENAFAVCPYNIDVYIQAMKYELLDYDSFQTAKIFKQDHFILSFLKEKWGEVSFPTKFNINYYCVNVWASITDKTTSDLLHDLTNSYANDIVKAYSGIGDMLADKELCRKVISGCAEDALLSGDAICKTKAHAYVDMIVSAIVWSQLIEQCGHADLLDRIKRKIPGLDSAITKREVDLLLEEMLYSIFEENRQVIESEIIAKYEADIRKRIQEDEKLAKERTKREDRARKIRKAIAAFTLICGLVLVSIVGLKVLDIYLLSPTQEYNTAVKLMEDGNYQNAYHILLSLNGFGDSDQLIKECLSTVYDDNIVQFIVNGQYEEAYRMLLSNRNEDQLTNFRVVYTKSNYSNAYFESTTSYTYDDCGNLLRSVVTYEEGDTKVTEYVYDENYRLIKKTITDSSVFETTYTYASDGRLLKETSVYGGDSYTYTYSYDSNGNLTKKSYTESGEYGERITNYEYNSSGQVIKELNSDGTYTYYEYGANNELIRKVYVWSDGHESFNCYQYDENGYLVKEFDSYGNSIEYSYDSNYFLIKKVEYDEKEISSITEYGEYIIFFSFID
jgi:YD repeat-containing protein